MTDEQKQVFEGWCDSLKATLRQGLSGMGERFDRIDARLDAQDAALDRIERNLNDGATAFIRLARNMASMRRRMEPPALATMSAACL